MNQYSTIRCQQHPLTCPYLFVGIIEVVRNVALDCVCDVAGVRGPVGRATVGLNAIY